MKRTARSWLRPLAGAGAAALGAVVGVIGNLLVDRWQWALAAGFVTGVVAIAALEVASRIQRPHATARPAAGASLSLPPMDRERLVAAALAALAAHRGGLGHTDARRVPDGALGAAIAARLGTTDAGRRILADLERSGYDARAVAGAADAIARVLASDPPLASWVAKQADDISTTASAPTGVAITVGGSSHLENKGVIAGGNVDMSDHSTRIGTGGLAVTAVAAVLAIVAGGVTVSIGAGIDAAWSSDEGDEPPDGGGEEVQAAPQSASSCTTGGESVRGRLALEDDGVAGARIFVSVEDGSPVESVHTAEDGSWCVAVPGPGTYRVELDGTTLPAGVVADSGQMAHFVSVREGAATMVIFPLGGGGSCGTGGESVAGVLRVHPDADRLPDVRVSVYADDGTTLASVRSQADGSWCVLVPGPGSYQVDLDESTLPDGVVSLWSDVATLVHPGGASQVGFALTTDSAPWVGRPPTCIQDGEVIWGRLDYESAYVANARVEVSKEDGAPVGSADSDREGYWCVGLPGPGPYRVDLEERTLPNELAATQGGTTLRVSVASGGATNAVFQLERV